MKWIVSGAHTAASRVLEFLSERGDEVWAVGRAADDGVDGWQPSFRAAAERLSLRFDQPRRINDPVFVERLAAFGARAFFSIQYDQILRRRFFEGIGCPCLNLHFSLLPRHRGMQPIAWAILCGDAEAGVTLHHMAVQIDAGDVIAQRRVAVDPGATARELYDASHEACFELFRESYPFPDELLHTRLAQDPQEALYHRAGDLDFSEPRTDWSRPAAELQPWLRAMIFPPFQYPETRWRGELLRVERVAGDLGDSSEGVAPGSVVGRDARRLEVAARDRTLFVTAIARAGRASEPSPSMLGRIAVGDRLG